MKYKYFIKEKKVLIKVNALGEPLEYETTYSICRTHVWLWLAELIPSLFAQYLWLANTKEAMRQLRNQEDIEICWVNWEPTEQFRYIDYAEDFLRQMQSSPNRFYITLYERI